LSTYAVTHKELEEFERAVVLACKRKSSERLEHSFSEGPADASLSLPDYFNAEDGSLVISFDAGWYPFLCNTRGYNTGPQRWYVPKVSRLIAMIARELQTPAQRRVSYVAGGRIFLNASGARRKPAGHGEIHVLSWTLPRESPLFGVSPRDAGTPLRS
jgi:hypothetical protein